MRALAYRIRVGLSDSSPISVQDERARRVGRASGATRTSTVIATVLSRLATLRPARPRAQASLPARRRTAVHRAAALGPVTSGLIASYERLGYG